MGLVFFILLIVITLVVLVFLIDSKIKLVFNSEKSDVKMALLWLSPLVKAFQYGFRDPFETGIACGVLNIASQFINIASMN